MSLPNLRMRIAAVATVAVVAVTGLTVGVRSQLAAETATLYADFTDVSPLIVGNDVKSRGVKVGQVASIEVHDGRARVGLHLEPAALPVYRDARLTIRPVSLLGERFVALDRGSPARPLLPAGGLIPVRQTGRSTDLDEVLTAVDQPTGAALAALVTTLGEGATGHGKDVDAAVRALAPAMTETRTLVRILDEQNAVLTRLVDRVEPVAGALAVDRGRRLDSLVDSTDVLLRTAAGNREALDATLAELPGTLTEARRTLTELTGVAEATTPTLRRLRPVTGDLTEISAELDRFAAAADPALASLEPVLRRANTLLTEAAPVVRTLEAAGPDLRGAAGSARPVALALIGNLRNVLDFVRFWALVTNGHDGLSHYFRASFVANTEVVTGPVPGAGKVVPKPQDLPLPGMPALPSLEIPALPSLEGVLPKLGPDDATGLTPAQEQSMLDHLIGGGK
ncbi:MAG TPA: MlaD family protein [Mycobacteriales bacterium]|jgi:phospholipid/cholesterol/gamma-HCH transport system substrate-binding protein|nr:MlaD family protein [Mycobacteriales bacterium]